MQADPVAEIMVRIFFLNAHVQVLRTMQDPVLFCMYLKIQMMKILPQKNYIFLVK